MAKRVNDPANYRRMSEPFPSAEEANTALGAFFDAVDEARKKYRMKDVHLVIDMSVMANDPATGETFEGAARTSAHFGDSGKAEEMAAWSLGTETAKRNAHIGRLMGRGARRGRGGDDDNG